MVAVGRFGRSIPPARRRRLSAMPAPAGHPMGHRMLPAVDDILRAILAESVGRGRFATATSLDFQLAAGTFARYRLKHLSVIRQPGEDARRMSLSDLRESGRRSFPGIKLMARPMSHFAPHLAKQRTITKDPLFGDVVPPVRLRNYSVGPSILVELPNPNGPMRNYINRELAREAEDPLVRTTHCI